MWAGLAAELWLLCNQLPEKREMLVQWSASPQVQRGGGLVFLSCATMNRMEIQTRCPVFVFAPLTWARPARPQHSVLAACPLSVSFPPTNPPPGPFFKKILVHPVNFVNVESSDVMVGFCWGRWQGRRRGTPVSLFGSGGCAG